MLRVKIKQWFQEAVRLDMEARQELKDALLKGHPKLDMFLDNITDQIQKAEKICLSRGLRLREKTIQDFTYDMTKYFMKGVEGEAVKRYESELAKRAREIEDAKVKEFEAVLSGNAEGEFAEAGVISNEEIDIQREKTLEAQAKNRIKESTSRSSPIIQ